MKDNEKLIDNESASKMSFDQSDIRKLDNRIVENSFEFENIVILLNIIFFYTRMSLG